LYFAFDESRIEALERRVNMTADEVRQANRVIDEQIAMLEPIWEAALATRDSAQQTLDEIGRIRQKAWERQLRNLREAEKQGS
jgi:hypothetical protein